MIWQNSSAIDTAISAPPISITATAIILPANQIISGEVVDGRVGGVLQYKLTAEELKAFIDYFNERKFTEDDKKEGSTNRDSLSDSTSVILRLDSEKEIYVYGTILNNTMITILGASRIHSALHDFFRFI